MWACIGRIRNPYQRHDPLAVSLILWDVGLAVLYQWGVPSKLFTCWSCFLYQLSDNLANHFLLSCTRVEPFLLNYSSPDVGRGGCHSHWVVIGNGFSGYCYFGQICSGIANLIIGSESMHCNVLSVCIMSATLTDSVCFIIFCCVDFCVLAINTTLTFTDLDSRSIFNWLTFVSAFLCNFVNHF